jgi:hypothetical protein
VTQISLPLIALQMWALDQARLLVSFHAPAGAGVGSDGRPLLRLLSLVLPVLELLGTPPAELVLLAEVAPKGVVWL